MKKNRVGKEKNGSRDSESRREKNAEGLLKCLQMLEVVSNCTLSRAKKRGSGLHFSKKE